MSSFKIFGRKGQVTFIIKALTLILSIIAFVMIVWQAQNFFPRTVESKQESQFKMNTMSTLQKLINDEDCLAYSYKNTTQKGVIDKKKLEEFEDKYKGIEPECARTLPFDYNIRVRTLPLDISTHQPEGVTGGIFGSILNRINDKKIIFVTDGSWSMHKPGGTYNGKQVSRIECVKIFLKNFIDRLGDNSKTSVIHYYVKPLGGSCTHPKLFPFTKVGGNRNMLKNKISTLSAERANTPMCQGLRQGFNYALSNGGDIIVLMTDGCENQCCKPPYSKEIAKNHKNKDVKVLTIGYGSGKVCYQDPLVKIAELTDGESFRARTCEQLMDKIPQKNIKTKEREWSFGVGESKDIGVGQFSTGEAKEDSLTITLPVSVRYGAHDYKRGVVYLKAVKGKLERLSGYINRVCRLGQEKGEDMQLFLRMHLNNPVRLEDSGKKEICMMGTEKTCKVLNCDLNIDFEDIKQEGNYLIRVKYDKSNNKIEVKT